MRISASSSVRQHQTKKNPAGKAGWNLLRDRAQGGRTWGLDAQTNCSTVLRISLNICRESCSVGCVNEICINTAAVTVTKNVNLLQHLMGFASLEHSRSVPNALSPSSWPGRWKVHRVACSAHLSRCSSVCKVYRLASSHHTPGHAELRGRLACRAAGACSPQLPRHQMPACVPRSGAAKVCVFEHR